MKGIKLLVTTAVLCLSCSAWAQSQEDVTKYINPMIGTGTVNQHSLKGNCFPGATTPFGMVQLSPDTKYNVNGNTASGYDYNDKQIFGFSHTHLNGTGCPDLLDVLIMPSSQDLETLLATKEYSCGYSHEREQAVAGYYSITLDDGIKAELTATTRTGMHRYNFGGKANNLIVDLVHYTDWGKLIDAQARLIDDYTLVGYRLMQGWQKFRKVYFYAQFSRPVKEKIMTSDRRVFRDGKLSNGRNVRVFLSFGESSEPLLVKVALSPNSIENAKENMQENKGWDFEAVREKAHEAWQRELANIRIDGTEEQKVIFYTGLYHAYIQPNIISDINGTYPRTDFAEGRLPKGQGHYSTFSLWDTYRAAHPLYTILQPQRVADFANSMLRQYDTYGYLPIWQLWGTDNYCMIGNHAIPVLVDAVLKGLPGIDAERVFQAVKGTSLTDHWNSPFKTYEKYGYMPEDLQTQSVSITLEESYDDACVARLANHLGKTADAEYFAKRSRNYRNLYDAETGFFRARMSDGKWIEPFDPLQYGGNGGNPYTEANAWQYLWYVPQDVPDMISLFGGNKQFEKKLDTFFTLPADQAKKNGNASGFIGQYAHGNEPSHHISYLYGYIGKDEKTQFYTNKIMNELYNSQQDGYSGNEDCGQMASWYIWSSIGFYPVDPALGEYRFGSPQLKKVEIQLPDGKTFTVKTNRTSPEQYKIKSVKLNGKRYKLNYITHQDIMNGGTLEFNMSK
ncbi:MAG: GH92 family glycosyl hydrolase [Prevotella sp.]|nr:GH92 family glycosyl hydrolase [Prevotella sp.]